MTSPTRIRKAVGQVLRQLREDVGLTQEELGFEARLHRTYVGSAERGERNISVEALDRWLRAAGCTWGDFGRQVDAALPARAPKAKGRSRQPVRSSRDAE